MAAAAATLATWAILAGAGPREVTIATAKGPATMPSPPGKVAVYDLGIIDTMGAIGIRPEGVPGGKSWVPYLQPTIDAGKDVGTIFEPNYEKLYAFKPDLVIVAARTARKKEELSKYFKTIDLTVGDERNFAEAMERMSDLGKLFNVEEKAKKERARMEALRDEVREAVKGKGNALILLVAGDKVSAFGAKSRFGWLHTALGIPMAAPDLKEATHGQPVSFEFVQKTDPDWLVVMDLVNAIGDLAGSFGLNPVKADKVLDNPLVRSTKAWKNGRVIYLDPSAYHAGGGAHQFEISFNMIKKAFDEKGVAQDENSGEASNGGSKMSKGE